MPGLATAYNNIAACFFRDSEYDSCGNYYRKSITIYCKDNDKLNLAKSYSKLAEVFMKLTQPDSSLKYDAMALPVFEKSGDKEHVADVLSNMELIQRKIAVLLPTKKSLGMKITRSRIDIINKLKNANAAVSVFDLAKGMRAEVKLPLELSF